MNRAVFLDRDGTIIVHLPYLADPDGVEIIEGGASALRALQAAGYLLIVVTNQSVIGRGNATRSEVDATNARMVELFAAENVTLHEVLYCPHAPVDNCDCRKPAPKLLLESAKRNVIDLSKSYMVGDNPTDIGAGIAAECGGCAFIGEDEDLPETVYRASSITDVSEWILSRGND